MKPFEDLKIRYRLPSVNHAAKASVMSEAFARAASEFGSNEFQYLMELQKTCPGYEVVSRKTRPSHNAPRKISYDKMRKYILTLRDRDFLMAQFESVIHYARSQPCPYNVVYHWFQATFPDYGSMVDFDAEGYPIVSVNASAARAPMWLMPEETSAEEMKEASQAV
jgi:hypothetical protein